jgi:hypothetical protein
MISSFSQRLPNRGFGLELQSAEFLKIHVLPDHLGGAIRNTFSHENHSTLQQDNMHGCIDCAFPLSHFSRPKYCSLTSTSASDFRVQIEWIVLALDCRLQGSELIVFKRFASRIPHGI